MTIAKRHNLFTFHVFMTTEAYAVSTFFCKRCGAITMNNACIKMSMIKELKHRIFKYMNKGFIAVPLLKNLFETALQDEELAKSDWSAVSEVTRRQIGM